MTAPAPTSANTSDSLDRHDNTFRRRSQTENDDTHARAVDFTTSTTVVLGSMAPPTTREAPPSTTSLSKHRHTHKNRGFMSLGMTMLRSLCSIKILVLLILCLQNSMFTVLRRYSQGVLKENYSKYEVLLTGELIKLVFSAWMIKQNLEEEQTGEGSEEKANFWKRLIYIVKNCQKMLALAAIYGAMNILSFVALRNIGAGLFTIFAQCKILTTATFSTILLQRHYSATKWRALIGLVFGVLLFSEPLWGPNASDRWKSPVNGESANTLLGTSAVLIEVTLSGFASIYFEKVIKTDPLKLNIWERNFQLALSSVPVYLAFIVADGGGPSGFGGGWSSVTWIVALLGAAGGLLVALSIKYGDAILKTLATTGAIVLSSVLDRVFLDGPLTSIMMIAGVQVILAIFNYTFDMTPAPPTPTEGSSSNDAQTKEIGIMNGMAEDKGGDEEMVPLNRNP